MSRWVSEAHLCPFAAMVRWGVEAFSVGWWSKLSWSLKSILFSLLWLLGLLIFFLYKTLVWFLKSWVWGCRCEIEFAPMACWCLWRLFASIFGELHTWQHPSRPSYSQTSVQSSVFLMDLFFVHEKISGCCKSCVNTNKCILMYILFL